MIYLPVSLFISSSPLPSLYQTSSIYPIFYLSTFTSLSSFLIFSFFTFVFPFQPFIYIPLTYFLLFSIVDKLILFLPFFFLPFHFFFLLFSPHPPPIPSYNYTSIFSILLVFSTTVRRLLHRLCPSVLPAIRPTDLSFFNSETSIVTEKWHGNITP